MHALRLCMERIVPPQRERCIHLELRPITSLQDLPVQYRDITIAIAEGRITPSEGESISNILSSHTHALGLAEMEKRVVELEAHIPIIEADRREASTFTASAEFQMLAGELDKSGRIKNFGNE